MATYNVSTIQQLQTAINTINTGAGGDTVILADGLYKMPDLGGLAQRYFEILKPNVTIRSSSGNRNAVIIEGDGMLLNGFLHGGPGITGYIFLVNAANFTLQGVTCQKVSLHCVQINAATNADNIVLRNCAFKDIFEMLVKGTADPNNAANYSEGGLIENCHFEYTAGIGPNSYIGGIDVHKGKNWIIRNNTDRKSTRLNSSHVSE
jgi:hypothetical protein